MTVIIVITFIIIYFIGIGVFGRFLNIKDNGGKSTDPFFYAVSMLWPIFIPVLLLVKVGKELCDYILKKN